MKKINGSVSIIVNRDHTVIEFYDNDSSTTFIQAKLTPEQLSLALSRLMNVDCEITANNLDIVGKKMEHKYLEIELPNESYRYDKNKLKQLFDDELKTNADGWVCDNYFNSQETFFKKNGKMYVKEIIRRWV